ncbi:MAG: response regulator transcription factor [Bacteroidota bacterium]
MHLTSREKEILHLIIEEEMSNSRIAKKLGIAIGTVDTHRKKLLQKFDVSNSVGLTKRAIRMNIIRV